MIARVSIAAQSNAHRPLFAESLPIRKAYQGLETLAQVLNTSQSTARYRMAFSTSGKLPLRFSACSFGGGSTFHLQKKRPQLWRRLGPLGLTPASQGGLGAGAEHQSGHLLLVPRQAVGLLKKGAAAMASVTYRD